MNTSNLQIQEKKKKEKHIKQCIFYSFLPYKDVSLQKSNFYCLSAFHRQVFGEGFIN